SGSVQPVATAQAGKTGDTSFREACLAGSDEAAAHTLCDGPVCGDVFRFRSAPDVLLPDGKIPRGRGWHPDKLGHAGHEYRPDCRTRHHGLLRLLPEAPGLAIHVCYRHL